MLMTCLLTPTQSRASEYDLGLIEPVNLDRDKSAWVILDARPLDEWRKGHLPGAISFNWKDYTDNSDVSYRIKPANKLAKALGQMGIDENAPIVVYGDVDTSWGGEGWAVWALTWIGHKGPLRLLNGGIDAWRDSALPLVSATTTQKRNPLNYQVSVRSNLNIGTAELIRRADEITLIDNRSWLEWVMGHLPNAVRVPWNDLYTGQDNRPISPADYRELLKDKGVPQDKPVVFYCTGGIRSGYAWLIHQLSGFSDGSNYEGGTEAWDKLSSP
jgi:thiosulfate/3-mercaptopyruvate sulfurtransferase